MEEAVLQSASATMSQAMVILSTAYWEFICVVFGWSVMVLARCALLEGPLKPDEFAHRIYVSGRMLEKLEELPILIAVASHR